MPTTLNEEQEMTTHEPVVALRGYLSETARHMEAWTATAREVQHALKCCLQVVVLLEQAGAQAAWEDVDAAHRVIAAAHQAATGTLPRLQAEMAKHLTMTLVGLQELRRAWHAPQEARAARPRR